MTGAVTAAELPATRGEVVRAIILAKTPDVPAVRNSRQFIDLPYGYPNEAYLLYAESVGIISATPRGEILPYAPVSRAALTAMLTRAFSLELKPAYSYTDVQSGDWFARYAGVAETYRLFALDDRQKWEPEKNVTMAEVDRALLLATALKNNDAGPIRIDDSTVKPSAPPTVYTVGAVRRQKVALVAAPAKKTFPLVRRTALSQPLSIEEKRTTILNMVNTIRGDYGLAPLVYSTQLEQSAQNYADIMAHQGFFSHVTPEGQTVKQRIDVTGFTDKTYRQDCRCIPGYALAENLARGQKTAEEAVHDWMESPEHRGAILNPSYTHTGIGLNAGLWVQHFGGLVLTKINY